MWTQNNLLLLFNVIQVPLMCAVKLTVLGNPAVGASYIAAGKAIVGNPSK